MEEGRSNFHVLRKRDQEDPFIRSENAYYQYLRPNPPRPIYNSYTIFPSNLNKGSLIREPPVQRPQRQQLISNHNNGLVHRFNKKLISKRKIVKDVSVEYCQTSVLHGVKYFVEPCRSVFERCIWAAILTLFVLIAIYLLWDTALVNLSIPIKIILENSNNPIETYDFPAVTFCPIAKISQDAAESWVKQAKKPDSMNDTEVLKLLPNLLHLLDLNYTPEVNFLQSLLDLNKIKAHEFYMNISVKCEDLLDHCKVRDETVVCENVFRMIQTYEGYCCSYNYFGVTQDLYINMSTKDTPTSPVRGFNSGDKSGLYVQTKINNNYGSIIASEGIKVLIHEPKNFPSFLTTERHIEPGYSARLAIVPNQIAADYSLIKESPDVRNCFFYNEKLLPGFSIYSHSNCIFDCRMDLFKKLCHCVPFYMPTHNDSTKKCGLEDLKCISKHKVVFLTLRLNATMNDLHIQEAHPCGCKAQCNQLTYHVALQSFPMNANNLSNQKYTNINVYFNRKMSTKYRRSTLSSAYDMLANFGGLLGLFMGFSFTAAFELIYTFTLRIFYQAYFERKRNFNSKVGHDVA